MAQMKTISRLIGFPGSLCHCCQARGEPFSSKLGPTNCEWGSHRWNLDRHHLSLPSSVTAHRQGGAARRGGLPCTPASDGSWNLFLARNRKPHAVKFPPAATLQTGLSYDFAAFGPDRILNPSPLPTACPLSAPAEAASPGFLAQVNRVPESDFQSRPRLGVRLQRI